MLRRSPCSSAECSLRLALAIPYDTDFHYFKPSGKWYASGEGYWPEFDISGWCHADIFRANCGMPGLIGNGEEFTVVVIPRENCEHPRAYPRLIKAVK